MARGCRTCGATIDGRSQYCDEHKPPARGKVAKCADCGQEKTMWGKGLCGNCYKKSYQKVAKCADCGQEKTIVSNGLCSNCANKRYQKVAKCADCGQEKMIMAKGLCLNCYNKMMNETRRGKIPRLRGHLDRPSPGLADEMRDWCISIDRTLDAAQDRYFINSSLQDPRIKELHPEGHATDAFATPPFTKLAFVYRAGKTSHATIISLPQPMNEDTTKKAEEALAKYREVHKTLLGKAEAQLAAEEMEEDAEVDDALLESLHAATLGDENRDNFGSDLVLPELAELAAAAGIWKSSHEEDVRAEHYYEMEDVRTDRACRALSTGQIPGRIQYGQKWYTPDPQSVNPTNTTRGVALAVFARSSDEAAPPVIINRMHLENFIVGDDWQRTRQQEEANNVHLPRTPLAASITSFVSPMPAWHAMPVHPNVGNSAFQNAFIYFLEQAHADGREVIILARGMSGFSTFPNNFGAILGRFGVGPRPLVVRFAVALRDRFVIHANCCMPRGPAIPFYLHKNDPQNGRGFHHTAPTNIRLIEDNYQRRNADPVATRINRWLMEETSARVGFMVNQMAGFVKYVRGAFRNKIVA